MSAELTSLKRVATQSQSHRWLIVAGGLICFAAMWLPLFGQPGHHTDDFVPMQDEYGYASWLWLLVPALVLPGTDAGTRLVNMSVRLVLVVAGSIGALALVVIAASLDSIALYFLPAPLAVLMIGAVGRGVARLTLLIAVGTLVTCALLFNAFARYGLLVLALGGVVLLIGAALWSRRLRIIQRAPVAAPLPHAIVR